MKTRLSSLVLCPCSPEHRSSSEPGPRCCSGWVHHKGAGTCVCVCVCVCVWVRTTVFPCKSHGKCELRQKLWKWYYSCGCLVDVRWFSSLHHCLTFFWHNCKKERNPEALGEADESPTTPYVIRICFIPSISLAASPAFWVCRAVFIMGCKESDLTLCRYWKNNMRLGLVMAKVAYWGAFSSNIGTAQSGQLPSHQRNQPWLDASYLQSLTLMSFNRLN